MARKDDSSPLTHVRPDMLRLAKKKDAEKLLKTVNKFLAIHYNGLPWEARFCIHTAKDGSFMIMASSPRYGYLFLRKGWEQSKEAMGII